MGRLSGVGGGKRGPNEGGVLSLGRRLRENVRGKKKGVMERKIMGKEEAKHFLLERKTMGEEEVKYFLLKKVQRLCVRGQPRKERRASANLGDRGNGCADFVEQDNSRKMLKSLNDYFNEGERGPSRGRHSMKF